MAVEFRCDKCGRLISTDAAGEGKLRCPGCGRRTAIPDALARLPQPQCPDEGPVAASADATDAARHPAAGEAMARVMPLAVSLFLHVGVVVLLSFVFMLIPAKVPATPVQAATVLSIDATRIPVTERPPTLERTEYNISPSPRGGKRKDEKVVFPKPDPSKALPVMGIPGAPSGGDVDMNTPGGRGDEGGPGPIFPPIIAHHVVYVIDRSGSMAETFDIVRDGLLGDISMLSGEQDFHVIFFSEGRQRPLENRPRRLVRATEANKLELDKFAKGVVVGGSTTNPIPALRRAFAVLARADRRRKGKIICLLTDGEFTDSRAVLAELAKLNAAGEVAIHTVLHEHRNEEAEKTLQAIAAGHGGRYRFVQAYDR